MTQPPDNPSPSRSRRWRAAILVLLAFTVLGPPIGSLIFSTAMLISPPASFRPSTFAVWLDRYQGFAMFSYLIGGPLAFLCGAYLALRTLRAGFFTWRETLASATAVAAIGLFAVAADGFLDADDWVAEGVGFEWQDIVFGGLFSFLLPSLSPPRRVDWFSCGRA